MRALPIDPILDDVVRQTLARGRLVLEAPPGAGKTTRVPAALLAAPSLTGRILVLEPRRLAARLAARRVADERGLALGEAVGYQVRFEKATSARTRLTFLTEGLFTRRLLADPHLDGVDAVVVDEVHERSLHTDLALVWLRRLLDGPRPDLKVVAMSATLEADVLAGFLGEAPIIRSEGRAYPVEVEHLDQPDDRPLEVQVRAAVRRLAREGLEGDVLVFLPGAAEIRRALGELSPLQEALGIEVATLHGEMPADEQDRAMAPGARPKVILSTNVAESSVTIEGVRVVVDSGLARRAGHNPWTGLASLETVRVSQASAIQRAGRAGRLGPGRCLRLYTRHDFDSRPAHDLPEVARTDLAETVLTLAALGAPRPDELAWPDPPPAAALTAASSLLADLGALDPDGKLTPQGRELLAWPLHPRLSRFLLEAHRRGIFRTGCQVAALLGERDLLGRGPVGDRDRARTVGPSDLTERLDRLAEAGTDAHRQRRLGLDPGAVRAVLRAARQLEARRPAGPPPPPPADREAALGEAVLAAWPDRVAQRRGPGRPELLLAEGGEVKQDPASVVQEAAYLVAVDVSELRRAGRSETRVRLASAIEPDWLLELFPERITEGIEVTWNPKARRVEAFSRMRFGQVVLAESREKAAGLPETTRLLAEQALRLGLETFSDPDRLADLDGRLRVAAAARPEAGFPRLDGDERAATVARLCEGRSSLAELEAQDLVEALLGTLPWALRQDLDRLAPTHLTLPGRKRAPVHYPVDAPPFVASRIQDFFGLTRTPRIADGAVPLQVRLLAPNGRPVQITQDLEGFWERHYPDIRRELSRRYPRHRWPESPG